MLKISDTSKVPEYFDCFVLESSGYFGDMDELYHVREVIENRDHAEKLYALWVRIMDDYDLCERDQIDDAELMDEIPADGGYCSLPEVEDLSLTWYNSIGLPFEVTLDTEEG